MSALAISKDVYFDCERKQLRYTAVDEDELVNRYAIIREDKPRDYIAEWFKWVAKVSKYFRKHILH